MPATKLTYTHFLLVGTFSTPKEAAQSADELQRVIVSLAASNQPGATHSSVPTRLEQRLAVYYKTNWPKTAEWIIREFVDDIDRVVSTFGQYVFISNPLPSVETPSLWYELLCRLGASVVYTLDERSESFFTQHVTAQAPDARTGTRIHRMFKKIRDLAQQRRLSEASQDVADIGVDVGTVAPGSIVTYNPTTQRLVLGRLRVDSARSMHRLYQYLLQQGFTDIRVRFQQENAHKEEL